MRDIRGFTLIKLMLMVTIIEVLASITIPAYQSYTIRIKVSEGLVLASEAKLAVVDTLGYMLSGSIKPYSGTEGMLLDRIFFNLPQLKI